MSDHGPTAAESELSYWKWRAKRLDAEMGELREQLDGYKALADHYSAQLRQIRGEDENWVLVPRENFDGLCDDRIELSGLRKSYDEMVGIAADLCRACGFSMVDASGEAV